MSIDLIADARAWLATQGDRVQTHSELCHRWHPACLVSRLVARLDSRAGQTDEKHGDSDAEHPERENTDHDAAPTAGVSDRQCAGHADIGGTIPDAEPAAIAEPSEWGTRREGQGTGNTHEPLTCWAVLLDGERADNEWTYRTRDAADEAASYILRHVPNAHVRVVPLVLLTDTERGAICGTSHFLCDLAGFDVKEDTKALLKKNAATLRGLLERTK